jgi:hypothetical protein
LSTVKFIREFGDMNDENDNVDDINESEGTEPNNDSEWGEDDDPKCPYCGAQVESCPHLLAEIDRTFGSFQGGYIFSRSGVFYNKIESVFETWLKSNEKPTLVWLEYEENELQELWNEAAANWATDSEYVFIDGDILMRMEIQLMEAAGAVEHESYFESGFPGGSSAMTTLYAEDPEKVLKKAVSILEELLESPNLIEP